MPNLNRVQLIGRLGRDPETRYTSKGTKICQFSVAVNDRWRSAEGENKERTDWFTVEAWGRWGEICQESLSKGRLVYIEGRLRTDQYEKDGVKHHTTRVLLGYMQSLERRPEEPEASPLPPPEPESEEFPF